MNKIANFLGTGESNKFANYYPTISRNRKKASKTKNKIIYLP